MSLWNRSNQTINPARPQAETDKQLPGGQTYYLWAFKQLSYFTVTENYKEHFKVDPKFLLSLSQKFRLKEKLEK